MLSLFSCCLHRRHSSDEAGHVEPTERSHLIPATTEPAAALIQPDSRAAEYERMKERMGNIVKNKEGKMVNLNSRLPFNLYNQKLAVRIDPSYTFTHGAGSMTSSSRSVSSSTQPSLNVNFAVSSSGTPHSHGQVQAHVGGPLTASTSHSTQQHGATANPDRSSSRGSRSRSSHLLDGENEEGSDRSRSLRSPVLGVRLVRGLPLNIAGKAKGLGAAGGSSGGVSPTVYPARRGRAKRKALGGTPLAEGSGLGVSSLDEGIACDMYLDTELLLPADAQFQTPTVAEEEGVPGSLSTPRGGGFVRAAIHHEDGHPTVSISPASSLGEFKLQDTGPLTVSWGD